MVPIIPIKAKYSFNLIALKDRFSIKNHVYRDFDHLMAVINWIKRAHDATVDGGVSAGYFLNKGWENSYPETTGYIIPTMFDFYHLSNDLDSKERAIRMSNFLVDIQMGNGAFPYGFIRKTREAPFVFDTGQCMQGLIRCYQETKLDKYLESAVKSGNWITAMQDNDGAWRRGAFHEIPHTYYTRVDIALLELYEVTQDKKYKDAAIKNIDWALKNIDDTGWFENCAFDVESMAYPTTHVIGYAVEGLLECGVLLGDELYIQSATKTLNSLLKIFNVEGRLKGTYSKNWKSIDCYSCLTGDAQIAALWLRLFELTKERAYYEGAVKLNNYIKSTQNLNHWDNGIRGGIKGSHPIYGGYNPYRFLNWAAKFFADSLIRQIKINENYY